MGRFVVPIVWMSLLAGCGSVEHDPEAEAEPAPNDIEPVCVTEAALLPDGDRDGYGAGTAETRCIDDGVPVGYSRWAQQDCDDENAAILPGAYEVPGDGIDSECDGDDDSVGCPGSCLCQASQVAVANRPTEPSCEGAPDLFLAVTSTCVDCFQAYVPLVIGNRGDQAAVNVTVIYAEGDARDMLTMDVIEPLSVTGLLRMPPSFAGNVAITLEVDGDCDASNNHQTFGALLAACK
jgi:hypothetical protein